MVPAEGVRWASQPAQPADDRNEESRRSSAALRHSVYSAEVS
jgi:hypothetical protein